MFKCECGKEFESAQSFNAHKSSCKQHYLAKYGNLDLWNKRIANISKRSKAANIDNAIKRQKESLQQWISEKHVCEHCGKVMTEKFGSGRFCCKACANSRAHSKETKQKLREAQQKKATPKTFICCVCGKEFKHHRPAKTCSHKCLLEFRSEKFKGNAFGGFRQGSVKNYKYGWYNNISCDSSYELAFVVYCLDHKIQITRNTEAFKYSYNNKQYNYYPDFICDGVYIEIKNYDTALVQAKIKDFPKDKPYKILYKQDLTAYIDYCVATYGQNFCEVLYDNTKPSYLDKNK